MQAWLQEGVAINEIAILSRQWDLLGPVRALLEQAGISTYALKGEGIALARNWSAHRLIQALGKAGASRVLAGDESVRDRFQAMFQQWQRAESEPTVQTLLRIGSELDEERCFQAEDGLRPISADEVLTTIFEFNASGAQFLQDNSVLVTSCHGAKGLEFRKVILLTDGFKTRPQELESERRLFYVAMTRAKESLLLCSTSSCRFVQEAGLQSQAVDYPHQSLPQQILYLDLTPKDVKLGHPATQRQQAVIEHLQEGEPLLLSTDSSQTGWAMYARRQCIGALSNAAVQALRDKHIHPGAFHFLPGEVTVRAIFRYLKVDEVTGEVLDEWFVPIPQIRVCR